MADWSIDPGFHEEDTVVPDGECETAENCGKTDCERCGEDAAAWLCAAALTGVAGIVALAREVNRTVGYGAQNAVTGRDLARLRDRGPERSHLSWGWSWTWAEGVLDAVGNRDAWLQRHDYEHDVNAQAAYMVGRLLVELWQVNERLTQMEAQAMADPSARAKITQERHVKAQETTRSDVRRSTAWDVRP